MGPEPATAGQAGGRARGSAPSGDGHLLCLDTDAGRSLMEALVAAGGLARMRRPERFAESIFELC